MQPWTSDLSRARPPALPPRSRRAAQVENPSLRRFFRSLPGTISARSIQCRLAGELVIAAALELETRAGNAACNARTLRGRSWVLRN